MINNSNDVFSKLQEKLEEAEKQYYEAVEAAINFGELMEEYEDIDEVSASDELCFNDKIDHMYYENSETRVSIYSILMEIIKEAEETQFDNGKNRQYSNKKIESFIGKLRWEKEVSNKIIENEQRLMQECDEIIAILDAIRGKDH